MLDDLARPTERFAAIASRVLEAKNLPLDPWFYRYCGATGDPAGADKYIRYMADTLRLGWPAGGEPVVIDAGSGFGFTLIAVVLLGARLAQGVEINHGMVQTVETYMPLLPDDVRQRITVTEGTVHEMPYADGSADLVLSFEAISHYRDVERFISEARRVLRSGGALLISDGNNGSNPLVRRGRSDIWQAFEQGPEGAQVHGHLVGVPYEQVRADLIAKQFPAISASDRRELARRTARYTSEQTAAAAQAYVEKGEMPDSLYRRGQLAFALDGTAMERLFSPHALAKQLDDSGFDARAYGYWGGAAGVGWVRRANRVLAALSRITMPTAPSFRIVARKR
jgi:SAM-dependent methyltransferase